MSPEDADLKKGRSLALRYLTYRARTAWELEEYLLKKGLAPEVLTEVMAQMRQYGYIDDEKFAANYINYRKSLNCGEVRIRFELQQKRVARAVVERALEESAKPEEALEQMAALLDKRKPKDGLYDQKWLNKQFAYLARRGYRKNQVRDALNKYINYDDLSLS